MPFAERTNKLLRVQRLGVTADPVKNHALYYCTVKKDERLMVLFKIPNVRILAAGALVLEFVFDVVAVAAGDHGQLGMRQGGLASVQLPEVSVAVPDAVNQPGSSVAHLVNQGVPEAV